jgi:hypothetical protein
LPNIASQLPPNPMKIIVIGKMQQVATPSELIEVR